jgi:signal transduction histidine kinase/FixJ family two-component response regulator
MGKLLPSLERQPPWSDLPVVMLIQGGVQSSGANSVLRSLRNVTLLERPAPTRSVVSAVLAAVRGRERQYEIREQIEAIRRAEARSRELQESERAARHEAERMSRMKDEFLATLSHELRTPLSAIFGWTQLLKLGQGDPRTVSEGIDVIDRNVRAQTRLIEDLLDVSRIVSGKVRLEVQRVDLPQLLSAAIEGVMPTLEAKGLRLEKKIDALPGPVSGDPSRLQQVLWNLLTNAIKFTPKGGLISVRAAPAGSQVQISIADSGEGIGPEFLPHLFERFSQADGSTKRRHGGLGLGLAIVKHLVELHGGTVVANSAGEGQGATFTIHLPWHVAKAGDPEQPQLGTSPAVSRTAHMSQELRDVKVLVVDDEGDSRELAKRLLVECGAIPALAGSVNEAEELLGRFKPDVILSDIGMPDQDGYEFMRHVRSRGIKTPAVALTAFARAEDRIRSIQAGFQTHLSKPVEPSELMAVIASLSGRSHASLSAEQELRPDAREPSELVKGGVTHEIET